MIQKETFTKKKKAYEKKQTEEKASAGIKNLNNTIEKQTEELMKSLLHRAKISFIKDDFDSALKDLNTIIHLGKENLNFIDATVYYNRGVCRSRKNDYEGAIADYTTAIQLKPSLQVHNS